MATYYVKNGGNDGSAGTSDATAWATLTKVSGSAFSPGDSILFKRGSTWACTATERLVVPSSGTAGSPITFGQYGSGTLPRFDGQMTSGILLYVNNKNYLIFDSLDLYRSGNYGMQVLGTSQNISVSSCTVSHSYHAGMVFDIGTSSILVDTCSIHHNNQTGTFHESVTFTGVNGFEIRYCDVYSNIKEGIDAKYGSTNGLIHHNICYENLLGIYIDSAHDIDVYDNLVYGNTKAGISFGLETNANRTDVYNLEVYNNILYGNDRGIDFWTDSPTANWQWHDIAIINNTFHANGGASSHGNIWVLNTTAGSPSHYNVTVRNNIFWEAAGNELRDDTAGNAVLALWTIDHNLFKTAASSEAFGTSAVTTADVLFIDKANHVYRLSGGSPAIDAGSATGAPATDYGGTARPVSSGYDIGAYEFTVSALRNINFAWIPNTEPDVNGYKIYCGETSGGPYTYSGSPKTISGQSTTTGFFTVTTAGTFYFRLVATDTEGLQSGYSAAEPSAVVTLGPAAPQNLALVW